MYLNDCLKKKLRQRPWTKQSDLMGRNGCGSEFETWHIVFDGGAKVALCALPSTSRDDIIQSARDILKTSSDFETQRTAMGRIVKIYRV
jgi:hypothetical protein